MFTVDGIDGYFGFIYMVMWDTHTAPQQKSGTLYELRGGPKKEKKKLPVNLSSSK